LFGSRFWLAHIWLGCASFAPEKKRDIRKKWGKMALQCPKFSGEKERRDGPIPDPRSQRPQGVAATNSQLADMKSQKHCINIGTSVLRWTMGHLNEPIVNCAVVGHTVKRSPFWDLHPHLHPRVTVKS